MPAKYVRVGYSKPADYLSKKIKTMASVRELLAEFKHEAANTRNARKGS